MKAEIIACTGGVNPFFNWYGNMIGKIVEVRLVSDVEAIDDECGAYLYRDLKIIE